MALQLMHHGLGTGQCLEQAEHQPQPGLYFLVRVERDGPRVITCQAGRQGHSKLTSGRLLPLALVQPQADLVQLGLAHEARQAQQQAVVIAAGIVQTFTIGDEPPVPI